jgi:hypothetical protein
MPSALNWEIRYLRLETKYLLFFNCKIGEIAWSVILESINAFAGGRQKQGER